MIVLLMLVTAALVLIITIGGWSVLQGAQIVAFFYIVLYVVMAFYVARWNRGLLPVCAAMSILLAVVAGVAAPGWFARDKAGLPGPEPGARVPGHAHDHPDPRLGPAGGVRHARLRAEVERRGRASHSEGYRDHDDTATAARRPPAPSARLQSHRLRRCRNW